MPANLNQKVAIITGVSSSDGATGLLLASDGVRVTLVSRLSGQLKQRLRLDS